MISGISILPRSDRDRIHLLLAELQAEGFLQLRLTAQAEGFLQLRLTAQAEGCMESWLSTQAEGCVFP